MGYTHTQTHEGFSVPFDFSYGVNENVVASFMRLNPDCVLPSVATMNANIGGRYKITMEEFTYLCWEVGKIKGMEPMSMTNCYDVYPDRTERDGDEDMWDDEEKAMGDERFWNGKGSLFSGDDDFAMSAFPFAVYAFKTTESICVLSMSLTQIKGIYDVSDKYGSETFLSVFRTVSKMYRNRLKKISRTQIYQVCSSQGMYYLKDAKVDYDSRYDFKMLYPDEFMPIADNIDSFIKGGKSGMVILHGLQGSGKTSYIRKLIHDNPSRRFVYLPMTMAAHLSSPDFVSFLHEKMRDSVVILEDCEQILESRDSGNGGGAISTLLNMSDGLLADGLNIQFICTFNAEIGRIDKALLRKGRLIDKYEFGKLGQEKAKALAELIHGSSEFVKGDMSLAEIFNMGSDNHAQEQPARKKIGF
jgi:hypothetical protein